jgi:hypothetical protein
VERVDGLGNDAADFKATIDEELVALIEAGNLRPQWQAKRKARN